ncbi:MAG: hypothetical protein IKD80_08890 [Selenomonadaceae bacterium]|nr:hypothetical protein [Selenomonadaceae bacterium]
MSYSVDVYISRARKHSLNSRLKPIEISVVGNFGGGRNYSFVCSKEYVS